MRARGVLLGCLLIALLPDPLWAGECTESFTPDSLVVQISRIPVDTTASDRDSYVLWCYERTFNDLAYRRDFPPSAYLFFEQRDGYHALILYPGMRKALRSHSRAMNKSVRAHAFRCLALSGDSTACDSVSAYPGQEDAPLVLAIAGHRTGLRRIAEGWLARLPALPVSDHPDRELEAARITLDAMYYSRLPEGAPVIQRVSTLKTWPTLRERASWMLAHPMPATRAGLKDWRRSLDATR